NQSGQLSIESSLITSSYSLNSSILPNQTEWYPLNESGMGDAEIQYKEIENTSFYSISLFGSDTDHFSAVQNSKFNLSNLPSPIEYPTIIDFTFRINETSEELLTSVHHSKIDMFFNNAVISLILSDYGFNGHELIDSMFYATPPPLTNLEIWCNSSDFFEWRNNKINLTNLLKRFFNQSSYGNYYTNFLHLDKVVCSLFSINSNYSMTVDMKEFCYYVDLTQSDLNFSYNINGTYFNTTNRLFTQSFNSCEINLIIHDYSSFNLSIDSIFNLTFTLDLTSYYYLILDDWNSTQTLINLEFSNDSLIAEANLIQYRFSLPKIYSIICSSFNVEIICLTNGTTNSDDFPLNNEYVLNTDKRMIVTLNLTSPNFITEVNISSEIYLNQYSVICGELLYPINGCLSLTLSNQTFEKKYSTNPMYNTSFSFFLYFNDSVLDIGLYTISIYFNSNSYMGGYNSTILIKKENNIYSIELSTTNLISVNRYSSVELNISLKIEEKIIFPSELKKLIVFLSFKNEIFYFTPVQNESYLYLTIPCFYWSTGNITGVITAVSEDGFYSNLDIYFIVQSASVSWQFYEFPEIIFKGVNNHFNISYTFIDEFNSSYFVEHLNILVFFQAFEITVKSTESGYFCFNLSVPITSTATHRDIIILLTFKDLIIETFTKTIPIYSQSDSNAKIVTLLFNRSSPVIVNQTYWKYYDVHYPESNFSWMYFIDLLAIENIQIESAFILNEYTVIPIQLINNTLRWELPRDKDEIDLLA
ncbi:MAG: hypothetical protein ACXAC7_23850, partial [Candidatus Hodarchaeales archaeon]